MSQPNWINKIFNELKTLQEDVKDIKRSVTHTASNSSPRFNRSVSRHQRPSNSTSFKNENGRRSNGETSKMRSLLNAAYEKPAATQICWFHKKFGIATNPANCPGLPSCSYDLPKEIIRMKELIAQASKATPKQSTSVQPRINLARSAVSNGNIVRPAAINQPEVTENETLAMDEDQNILEDDLLLSDTE